MFNTSAAYREAIQADVRDFRIKGILTSRDGDVVEFDDRDVVLGSYVHNASSQPGDLFQHGGAVAKDMSIKIYDQGYDEENPETINFSGGTITVQVGVIPIIPEFGRNIELNADFRRNELDNWNVSNMSQTILNKTHMSTVTNTNNPFIEYTTKELDVGNYVYSLLIKSDKELQFKNISGVKYDSTFVGKSNEYQWVSMSLEVLQKQRVSLKIYINNPSIGDKIHIDKFKLEKGIEKTPWSIAPEDSDKTDIIVWTPMGKFYIDEFKQREEVMDIKAIDEMVLLDRDYDNSKLTYPASLLQIYSNICSDNNIMMRTVSFNNSNLIIPTKPEGTTYREVLQFVAELSGTFAQMSRLGGLELKWFTQHLDYDITPNDRMSFDKDDFITSIPGLYYEYEREDDEKSIEILIGQELGVLDLSENKLLHSIESPSEVLQSVFDIVSDISFEPYSISYVGDPSLDVGDIVTQTTLRGETIISPITNLSFSFKGTQTIEGNGQDYRIKQFVGGVSSAVKQIVQKQRQEIERVSDLELATDNMTNLIVNTLGGFVTQEDNAMYIHDMPNLDDSMHVWKWGLGGFGYSETGKDGVYIAGIDASGTLVARLVVAGIVTADMIKTGLLQSKDGKTWFNLETGEFKLTDDKGSSLITPLGVANTDNITVIDNVQNG